MDVHLVDGTFELFRAYYGAPGALSPSGQEVGATRGLMRSLEALLKSGATHIAVAFDHVIESFRNELFPGYKTGEGIEPALYAQFPLAERATRALGIVTWSMVEFEADDALATAAKRYAQDSRVAKIILCTPDKDLAQAVDGERVVMWDRVRDRVFDHGAVVEKFGIPPASIPDFLALVGDTADGIPGIPRWGAKSAAAVLAHYGHLEAIPDDDAHWAVKVRGARVLAENLRMARDAANLYRQLATLRVDANVSESLDDLEWKGRDESAFRAFRAELGIS